MVVKGTDYDTESEALIGRIAPFGGRARGWNEEVRSRCDETGTDSLTARSSVFSAPDDGADGGGPVWAAHATPAIVFVRTPMISHSSLRCVQTSHYTERASILFLVNQFLAIQCTF